MPEFTLTPDQVGELDNEGVITKHPSLDIVGGDASSVTARVNATRKRLSKTQFVVIPPGRDSEDNTFKLPSSILAPRSKE